MRTIIGFKEFESNILNLSYTIDLTLHV